MRIFFKPIPEPGYDDWLANHHAKERKQNFETYKYSKTPVHQNKKIYLIPIGTLHQDVPLDSKDYPSTPSLTILSEFAEAFFSPLTVVTLPPLLLSSEKGDKYAFTWKFDVYNITKRINGSWYQLYTKDINDVLYTIKQTLPDAYSVTAVTMYDLYPDPSWNFVFGQARLKQSVGVFSFIRYGDFFYNYHGKPLQVVPDTSRLEIESYSIFLKRCLKVMFHETCHMFGIEHCTFFTCPMTGSNHLAESDSRPMFLCPMDLHKLQYVLGFDVIERYKLLENFYKKYEMFFSEEVEWIGRRLEWIEEKKKLSLNLNW